MVGVSPINVLVLLSGGIDSAACLYYYLRSGYRVLGLYIDYGQIASKYEKLSAEQIANNYSITLNSIEIKTQNKFAEGEILGRNAFLIISGLMYGGITHGIISIGIHSSTSYYDCSELFIERINRVVEDYTGGKIIIEAPFLKWKRKMIIDYCKKFDIPLQLTYSCENGFDPPCGRCQSCRDRRDIDVG